MKSNKVILLGEISSRAIIDYEQVVKDTVEHIGYNASELEITNLIEQQVVEIADCVHSHWEKMDENIGAGDQVRLDLWIPHEPKQLTQPV